MGNITIQGDITATVPGNAVGGASALTTVGSVPFVTAAGVLGQSANLFWDNANGQLRLTQAGSTAALLVRDGTNPQIRITDSTLSFKLQSVGGASALLGTESNHTFAFFINNTERARFAATSGNLLLGTTTDDGTNRLQVAGGARFTTTANGTPVFVSLSATGTGSDAAVDTVGSGAYINLRSTLASPYAGTQINRSTNTVLWFTGTQGLDSYGWFTGSSFTRLASLTTGGTLTLYNETPTTGSTSFVVRAGAGQSGNLFSVRNASNVEQFWVNAFGPEANNFIAVTRFRTNSNEVGIEATSGLDLASNRLIRYSSTTDYSGTKDLSLSRASANTLQVGDGGTNANGTVNTKSIVLATSAASGTHIIFDTNTGADGVISSTSAGSLQFGTTNGGPLALIHNNVELLQLSPNTVTVTNPTPTTGSTSLVVRAGAGQGTNLLQQWQNSSGSSRLQVTSTLGMQALGTFFAVQDSGGTINRAILQSTLDFNDSGSVRWSSTGDAGGTIDLAARRRAAGLLSLDSGTAIGTTPGNARDIMARGFYAAETTTDPSAADLSIAGSNAQDTFRLYMKNDKLVIAYQRSGTVNYLTIPLDGATTTFTQSTTAP